MIFSVCFQLLPPWVIHHAKSQASTFPLLQWASTLPGAKQVTGQRLYGTEMQDIGHIGQVKLVSIYRVSEEQVVSLTEFHLNDDEKQVLLMSHDLVAVHWGYPFTKKETQPLFCSQGGK